MKDKFYKHIVDLQKIICSTFEKIDDSAVFNEDVWKRKEGGGGITSQYEIEHDGGKYDILLMHGNKNNKILSQSAVTDGVSLSSFTPPETSQTADGTPKPAQVEAATRAKEYTKMNKAEMNSAYDDLRKSDPAKAAIEGKKMHRAFFNK